MRRLIQREFAFDEIERTSEHESPLPAFLLGYSANPTLAPEARGDGGAAGDLEPAALFSGNREAAQRWRKNLGQSPTAAPDFEFTEANDNQQNLNSDSFRWLWIRNVSDANDRPRQALHLSTGFSKGALRGAIIANGGALIALALTTQFVDVDRRVDIEAAGIVLGLGLVLAAASTVMAYLNFQLADAFWSTLATKQETRIISRIKASFWLATGSGAGSYAAFALGAFWFLASH